MNYFNNENTNVFNENAQYYQHNSNNASWEDLIRYRHEEECYAEYDRNMADTVVEAEYEDLCYYNEEQEEDNTQHDGTMMEEEYSYENDSLLSLIVGVQSYLTEQATAGAIKGKSDSPLYELQYKMYTYMKQRAYEMGVKLQ